MVPARSAAAPGSSTGKSESGKPAARHRPKSVPGIVIASGIVFSSKSMNVAASHQRDQDRVGQELHVQHRGGGSNQAGRDAGAVRSCSTSQ